MAGAGQSRDVTSNCRRVALGTRRPRWAARWWGWAVWWAWKRALGIDDSVQGEVWELSVWTPPEFARNLFCWFSPVQLVTLSFMNGSNWYYILPMAAAVAGQCTVLVLAYATMAKDRQILYGEMHNEYNETFVNPRVFAPKRDAGTSTMQDWAQEHRRGLAAHHGAGWSAAMDQHRAPAAAVPAPYASDRVGGRRHEARRTTMLTSIGGSRAADDAKSRDLYGHSSRYSQNIDPALLLGRGTSYLQAMEPAGSFKPRDRALSRRRYTDMADGADVT
ncbi:hypothetical protein GGI02_002267 [Coemansia sp. RSA 2322]|nr:hypothetical protein GGI02_002267 [Coemansia sp. RSA 2322]